MTNSAIFKAGRTAVIFGGASGIGLAAAQHCAGQGMKLVLIDRSEEDLETALALLSETADLITACLDVSELEAIEALRDQLVASGADIALVMNNAGHGSGGAGAYTGLKKWRRVFETNFWGVVNGVHVFTPVLVAAGKPAAIVNTGSKQGITNPPGDLAYNTTKAAVKTLTEGLQHALRTRDGCQVSAHLLIPGFTYTGLMKGHFPTKPPGAWTSEQVVERMVEGLARGDFYILCPDNETSEEMDQKRILWGAGDLVENRPALSRWSDAFKDAFAEYMQGVAKPS